MQLHGASTEGAEAVRAAPACSAPKADMAEDSLPGSPDTTWLESAVEAELPSSEGVAVVSARGGVMPSTPHPNSGALSTRRCTVSAMLTILNALWATPDCFIMFSCLCGTRSLVAAKCIIRIHVRICLAPTCLPNQPGIRSNASAYKTATGYRPRIQKRFASVPDGLPGLATNTQVQVLSHS